jgi:hypothetical protein
VLTKLYPPAAALALFSGTIADGINWVLDTGDDAIATQTVVNPRALLESYAAQWMSPYIGYRLQTNLLATPPVVPVVANPQYHFVTTHKGGGATYVAGFEVTRKPPLEKPVAIV